MNCSSCAHAVLDQTRRRRHEAARCPGGCRRSSSGCAGTRRAAARHRDPGPAAGRGFRAAGGWRAGSPPQPGQAVLQGCHVAGDLDHVVERNAGCFLQLEQQQIGEGRLGALDLGGEHGLAPHVGVEEQLGIGQQGGDTIQAAAGQQRLLVQGLQGSSQHHRRLRGQRRRHEGPHRFPGGAGDLVVAGGLTPHGPPPRRTLNTPSAYSRK